jgi:hypothetical protein
MHVQIAVPRIYFGQYELRCREYDSSLDFHLACPSATDKATARYHAIVSLSTAPGSRSRLLGKQYATTYAAKEVQVGIAVTRPLCNDDFWAMAMRPMQTLARAIVTRMYLRWSV